MVGLIIGLTLRAAASYKKVLLYKDGYGIIRL